MSWNQTLTNLRDILADLYPTIPQSQVILADAKVPTSFISFDSAAVVNWQNILRYADNRNMVRPIVEAAYKESKKDELKLYLDQGELPALKGADIEAEVQWQAPMESDVLEKIIGRESTLLPISFLEVALDKARSVARIARADGTLGTGFLVDRNLLITNNHVLPSKSEAKNARAQFNYQLAPSGLAMPVEEFKFAPEGVGGAFVTSVVDDWTVVRLQGNPNDRWGAIGLARAVPQEGERVNIIQHPMGGPKQLALYHNVVVFVGHDRLQYLTDTLPGSSGSPVFNSDWQVVALHHSGGNLREPGTKRVYYRNEGIHINAVIDGLPADM